MKPLIRNSLMFGLMGSTLLVPALMGRISSNVFPKVQAIALPAQEVNQRLQVVPVFTITNNQGQPLLASQTGQDKRKLGIFFFSQQEAQTTLNQIKAKTPQLGKSAQITAVGLDKAYELTQRNTKETAFRFMPPAKQMQAAVKVLQAEGKKVQQFNNIPVFFATAGEKEKGYLTIQQGKQQVIPLFLSKEDLDGFLVQLRQKNPKLAATTKVGVGSFEGTVKLLKEKNEPQLKQIAIIPSQESLKFIRSQQAAAPKK